MWVNSGHVRAKIIKPDIKVVNGWMHLIDGVLGVPTMDLPNFIYYEDDLLSTFWDIQSVGLVQYIEDPRFNKTSLPPRKFHNTDSQTGQQTTMYPGQQTTMYPGQQMTQYPGQQTIRYSGQQTSQQTTMNLGHQTSQQTTMHPGQQTTMNPGHQTSQHTTMHPGQQTTMYPGQQTSQQTTMHPGQQTTMNPGSCGDLNMVCHFTYFVPNGSAIWDYKQTAYGRQISMNPDLYRNILRRTLIQGRVEYIEEMTPGGMQQEYRTDTGETIFLRKESENSAHLSWSPSDQPDLRVTADVIIWDLGVTNGVIHIIDKVLSTSTDLLIEPNEVTTTTTKADDDVTTEHVKVTDNVLTSSTDFSTDTNGVTTEHVNITDNVLTSSTDLSTVTNGATAYRAFVFNLIALCILAQFYN